MSNKLIFVLPTRDRTMIIHENTHDRVIAYRISDTAEAWPGDSYRQASVFFATERDVTIVLESLSKRYPDRTIRVFDLVEEVYTPSAPMVRKAVTKDGILPV